MRRGFTLIEQLAAAALAVLLMMGALGVLRGAGRDQARLTSRANDHVAPDAMRLIRWDMENASRVRGGRDAVVLSGFNSLDAGSLRPTHRPVRVTYAVSAGYLRRTQEALDIAGNRNGWSELVCGGVSSIEITPLAPPPPTTRPSVGPFGDSDGVPLGNSARVVVRPAVPDGPSIDEMVWIR
jgi:prepilin-type N-terminal cleavage/methylation domain-containing protein